MGYMGRLTSQPARKSAPS